ncbi:hypothetical protein FBUS_02126 [Fasciolopsis buskii]|uniref:Uncharacterized protein n=1 Tax=Fasciolopsis buskii TaxID=27845 RepID=A0A8E0RXG2_9TREM|nr:hypothetical protein FBUS_02126 [Fasciolopsis buski]
MVECWQSALYESYSSGLPPVCYATLFFLPRSNFSASLAIHEERLTGEKPRSCRTSGASTVPPTSRTTVPFNKFAIPGPKNPLQLQETGTCPTDHLHSCHLTRTISPAASLCHNQTIPLQISLGGRSISSLTAQSIPSLAIVSPESNDAMLDAAEAGTVGSGEPKKQKWYSLFCTELL